MAANNQTYSSRRALAFSAATLALVGGAYTFGHNASAQPGVPPAVTSPAIRDAANLQNAFTQIATIVEPAVVTITTESAARRVPTTQFRQFGPGTGNGVDPFEELLRRFRQRGGGGEIPEMEPNKAPRDNSDLFQPTQERGGGGGALGTGFIYDADGLIMTNAHVVEGADRVTVKLADGRTFKARVLGADSRADIAVVKIDATRLPTVRLGDSSQVKVGQWAVAVGNPFGLSNTLTVGVISATAREVPSSASSPSDFIQTDASINRGNSGGPLLDIEGRVVGVNSAIYSPSGGSVGIGFAIPVNSARQVADELVRNGRVRRARLGVAIAAIDDNASAYGLPEGTQGVLIQSVEPNGPAARAGLQSGDVLTKLNNEPVTRPTDLQRRVAASPIDQNATLTVLRGGQTLNLSARLAEVTDSQTASANNNGGRTTPAVPREARPATLGVMVAPVTPEVARQYRLSANVKGVVVADVSDNSPAARAGLQEGDVISRVGQTTVGTQEELQSAVRRILGSQPNAQNEKRVALYVTRGNDSSYVVVTTDGANTAR